MTSDVNKHFTNVAEKGNAVFSYLGDVREDDEYNKPVYTPDEELPVESDAPRIKGNYRSGNLTTRIDHIPSDRPSYSGHRDLGDITIMPKPMQRKHANGTNTANTGSNTSSGGWLSNLGRVTFKGIEDFRRKIFFNSPILESTAVGGLAGLGIYATAPYLMKFVGFDPIKDEWGRTVRNRKTGEPVYVDHTDRWGSALAVGLGIAGLNMLRGVNFKDFKADQLWRMQKRASMLGPIDYVPTQFAMNAVTLDPNIPDNLKYNTLHALGTINQPMINSTDMVNAGIHSGVSGSTGFPVGRIAAASVADALTAYGVGKLMGSSDPSRLAGGVGAISALGRLVYNSFGNDN
jgi:hypothetical protein